MKMKVLMVGATGTYASHVVPELKQRGVTIHALVRDKDKIDTARQQGADELDSPIEAGEPTFEEWAQTAHIPEGAIREGMKKMYAHYDRYGFPGGNALVLRAILGREPRPLRQYFYELASR
jgi:nucleoside-diphosphate-sugar epimerase